MRLVLLTSALCAALAASPAAEAAQGRNAALIGGLAVGAAAGAILMNGMRPARAAPPPSAVVVDEEYVAPRPRYVPTCRMERRRVWLDEGHYTYRRVEVCE